ncbi:MAG: TonB family protein [Xanthomonadales bacterium]|nr:TonB family protein [Xanthomonadales bacterium]
MATQDIRGRRQRVAAGGITFGVHILLLAILLFAPGRDRTPAPRADVVPVTLKDVAPPPPPRQRARVSRPRIRAVTIVPRPTPSAPAPPPPPTVIVPLAIPAPAAPGIGGTGSGGAGNGNGGGGGAGGAGDGTPPQRIGGGISDRDYPRELSDAGISGTVSVRYRVGIDGRARDCIVTRSSGSAALDAHTCALIERRFRFRPSRDADGRPVPSIIVENHSWIMPPPEPEAAAKDR